MKPLATMISTKQPAVVKKPAPFNNNYINSGKTQENMLMQQFAANRGKLAQDKATAMDQSKQGFDRLQARVGGTVGGSLEKARQIQNNDLSQKFAQADTEATAAEAAAKGDLYGKQQQLGIQQKQFDETSKQFAEQMKFHWAELDETKKNDVVNASIAFKQAELDNNDYYSRLSGLLRNLGYDAPGSSNPPSTVAANVPVVANNAPWRR